MYEQYGLFVDGRWRPAGDGGTYAVINPATEEPIGRAPLATRADAEAAIAAAHKALTGWRRTQPWERARIIRGIGEAMRARLDEMARLMTLEVGKPLAQAKGEIQGSIDQFEWHAEETKRIYGQIIESRLPNATMQVTYEPVGVVAAFAAWNFPAVLLSRKIAPALAAGCTIIGRPSEETPGVGMLIVKCCEEAGVPPGVVNLLTGKSSTISPVLMASPLVRKISLTGSTAVGKLLMKAAADTMKRVSMELGGHAPVIVHEDVDVEQVAALSAQAKFRNAGQVCIAPTRFYVHESQAKPFTERFVAVTRALKLGDGLAPDTDVGPLATRKRLEQVEALVEDTKGSGARLLTGGRRPPGFNRGFFYEPTVFDQVPDEARIMHEEPFGPVAPITTFSDFDDVIRRANATSYGLASYVFTRSLKKAHESCEALESGMVAVNTYALATAEAPFGGIKESGFGREGGSLGIKDYLDVKYKNIVMA
ncbi:MAG: NAD-dependent succinate-semialdehyde dehydrogenase [Rhodospirillaceae bacterium]|nr:NAD-dependent succinate-semialdehyde dehydrogenase [Rhodospirillaceae bacterium]